MTLVEFREPIAASPISIEEKFSGGIGYEANEVPSWFIEPLMRLMVNQVRLRRMNGSAGGINHTLFDGLGKLCREIKEGAASWKALDIIYNYRDNGSIIDRFWIRRMKNAQAVRNRKRDIVTQLREFCRATIDRKGSVKILSLASGSAQAVFEALEGFSDRDVEALLIDFDKAAGPYARELARRYGFQDRVTFKQGNLLKFDRPVMIGEFRPDVIEMAGLLDYLQDEEAVTLMRRIHGVLPKGGRFITCHIHDNPERDFMTEVIEWGRDDGKQRPMLYRTRNQLLSLIREAGFNVITLFVEPHRIHSVAVAEKT